MSDNINDKQYIIHYKVHKGKILSFRNVPFEEDHYLIDKDYPGVSTSTEDIQVIDDWIYMPSKSWIQSAGRLEDDDSHIHADEDFTIYFRIKLVNPDYNTKYIILQDGQTLKNYEKYASEYAVQIFIHEYALNVVHGLSSQGNIKNVINKANVSGLLDKKAHHIAITRYRGIMRAYLDGKKIFDSEYNENNDSFFLPSWKGNNDLTNKQYYPDILIGSINNEKPFYINDLVVCRNFAFYRYFDFSVVPDDILDPYGTVYNVVVGVTLELPTEVIYYMSSNSDTNIMYEGEFNFDVYYRTAESVELFLPTERTIELKEADFKFDTYYNYKYDLELDLDTSREIKYEDTVIRYHLKRNVLYDLTSKHDTFMKLLLENKDNEPINNTDTKRKVLYKAKDENNPGSDDVKNDTLYQLIVDMLKNEDGSSGLKTLTQRIVTKLLEHKQDLLLKAIIQRKNDEPINKTDTKRKILANMFTNSDGTPKVPKWDLCRILSKDFDGISFDTNRSVVYGLDKNGNNPHIKPFDTLYILMLTRTSTDKPLVSEDTKRKVKETWYLITPINLVLYLVHSQNLESINTISIKAKFSTKRYIKNYTKPLTAFIYNTKIQLIDDKNN